MSIKVKALLLTLVVYAAMGLAAARGVPDFF
jgi:hypothetical protein